MDQQQSYRPGPSGASAPNQYDFIMNPQPNPGPKRLTSPAGLFFIVGVLVVIVVLFAVIFSINRGGGGDTKPFVRAAQEQQEMARVAKLQFSSLTQQNVKNFAMNTQLSMMSDQQLLTTYLKQHGSGVSAKTLNAGMHGQTDTALANALSTNSLDAAVLSELQNELQAYQATLSQAYTGTHSASARALLTQLNDHAKLLLAQSKQ